MGGLNSCKLSKDKSANLNSHETPVKTLYKIILDGDFGVGKTEIMYHIMDKSLSESYNSSIGFEFIPKNIKFGGQNIKFQIWDISGLECYSSILSSYYRNSSIVFLVYDISSRTSFENIWTWIDSIFRIENTKLVLCGNITDLNSRQVSKEEGEDLAQQLNIDFFEVNSKTGENIKNMFYNVIADLPCFNKMNLVKELLNENEFKNEEEGINNPTTKCDVENQMDINIVSDKF